MLFILFVSSSLHQSSTLVGAGECRNGTTACQSQFPVDVMNGQTCPTAAPTPK